MEWLLLLYPLVGLYMLPSLLRRRIRVEDEHWRVIKHSLYDFEIWAVGWLQSTVWPVLVIVMYAEKRAAASKALKQEAGDFEALLERVRREDRAKVKQEFAEFDKELRLGEPEWKKAHPSAAMEWEERTVTTALGSPTAYSHEYYIEDARLCDEPQFRVKDIAPISWDEEQLARIEYTKTLGKMIFNRSLPNYSEGGKIGP